VEGQQRVPQIPDFWTWHQLADFKRDIFDETKRCQQSAAGFVELTSLKGRNSMLPIACLPRLPDGAKANAKTKRVKSRWKRRRWLWKPPSVLFVHVRFLKKKQKIKELQFSFGNVERHSFYLYQLSYSVAFRTRKALERQQRFPKIRDVWTSITINKLQKECFWRDQTLAAPRQF